MPNSVQPTRLPCPWDSPSKNTEVGCHFLLQCMKVKSEMEFTQSCLTVCDPMEWSPPGSSVHGILQAGILEWVAMPSSRGNLPDPGIEPAFLTSPALAGGFFTTRATWEPSLLLSQEWKVIKKGILGQGNYAVHRTFLKNCCVTISGV